MGEHSLLSTLESKVLSAIKLINELKQENQRLISENTSLKDTLNSHDSKISELEALIEKAEHEHEEFENLVLSVIHNLEEVGVEHTALSTKATNKTKRPATDTTKGSARHSINETIDKTIGENSVLSLDENLALDKNVSEDLTKNQNQTDISPPAETSIKPEEEYTDTFEIGELDLEQVEDDSHVHEDTPYDALSEETSPQKDVSIDNDDSFAFFDEEILEESST